MAKLYFYYASMNAGKSTNLLQADFNYRERGMQTMLYTAAIDDRVAKGAIGWGCWTAHSDYNDKEPYQEQLIGQEKK